MHFEITIAMPFVPITDNDCFLPLIKNLDLDTEIAIGEAAFVRVFPIRENPFGTSTTSPSLPAVQEYTLSDSGSDQEWF